MLLFRSSFVHDDKRVKMDMITISLEQNATNGNIPPVKRMHCPGLSLFSAAGAVVGTGVLHLIIF